MSSEEKEGRLRTIVREEVKAVFAEEFAKAVVPKGYERCAVCGEYKKIDRACPYCEEKRTPEEKDAVEELFED